MHRSFVLAMVLGLVVFIGGNNSSTAQSADSNKDNKAGYDISGLLLYTNGQPACGNVADAVDLTAPDGKRVARADCKTGGRFSFTNINNGTYYVIPNIHASVGGVEFKPNYLKLTMNSADINNVTFRGEQYSGYAIDGRVVNTGGVGIPSANVVLTPQSGRSKTVQTNPWGYYAFWGVLNGVYTVSVTNCNAPSQSVTISNGNQNDINFTCK